MEQIYIYEDLEGSVGALPEKPDFEVKYLTRATLTSQQVHDIIMGDKSHIEKIMANYKEPRLDL